MDMDKEMNKPHDLNRRIALVKGFPDEFNLMVLPNWANDLNTMWDLEEGLDCYELHDYVIALLGNVEHICGENQGRWRLAHATAQQRAEAWLTVKESTP